MAVGDIYRFRDTEAVITMGPYTVSPRLQYASVLRIYSFKLAPCVVIPAGLVLPEECYASLNAYPSELKSNLQEKIGKVPEEYMSFFRNISAAASFYYYGYK